MLVKPHEVGHYSVDRRVGAWTGPLLAEFEGSRGAIGNDFKPVREVGQVTVQQGRGLAQSPFDLNIKGTELPCELSCKVTDAQGHTQEGGYVFVVRGEGFDGRDFRFNQLELVADKKEYVPGDTVYLMMSMGGDAVPFPSLADIGYLLASG